MKKILFLSYTASLGGGELCLLDMVTGMKQDYGAQVMVILLNDGPLRHKLESLGIPVQIIGAAESLAAVKTNSFWASVGAWRGVIASARVIAQQSQTYDLIHANNLKAFVIAAVARLWGGAPVVWHLHDILTAHIFGKLNRIIAVTLANYLAARVIVNSQATAAAFAQVGGDRRKVRVVYNGFSATRFAPITPAMVQQARMDLGLAPTDFVVGMFSRLSPWKGQHILLAAAELAHLPNLRLIFVGEALFGETKYADQLRETAAQPDLAHKVQWLGFRSDIPLLMKTCDVIVHGSTEPEPFGRVIVEAQLAQRPVIATAAGGALEIIQDQVNGLLVPPADASALVQGLQLLHDQPELRQQLVAAGYENALTKFGLPQVLASFNDAIN
ncbi:MAG: glycosyltransferase family 4 protein [Pseudanabaena sp. ELA607]|jgi:glycosyltransferase involved in cell wall biosynthesis